MPKVLHIGPCETPGGMANVMHILAAHPPEGWEAELLSSHVAGSPWAKWRAYRKAMQALIKVLRDPKKRPDVIHLHTAADWSWRRKRRFARVANKETIPHIVHIHSGQFDAWLKKSKLTHHRFVSSIRKYGSEVVVLSGSWKEILEHIIGPVKVIHNPINPNICHDSTVIRDTHHLLLMGRNDPIKGHQFAIDLIHELRKIYPSAKLSLTGVTHSDKQWIQALGWVSEKEKLSLLQRASVVLLPSTFEGQPLVALEALATNCPVIASNTVHGLPSSVLTAEYGNLPSWIEAYQSAPGLQVVEEAQGFQIESIRMQWGEYYCEILSTKI